MSDMPPTVRGGIAIYDKNRLSNIFQHIGNKTKLEKPLIIHRYNH